jgi:hypothetical protein
MCSLKCVISEVSADSCPYSKTKAVVLSSDIFQFYFLSFFYVKFKEFILLLLGLNNPKLSQLVRF